MKKYLTPLFLGLVVGIFMLFGPAWIPAFGDFVGEKFFPQSAVPADEVAKYQIIYLSLSYIFFLIYGMFLFAQEKFRLLKNKLSFLFFSFLFFSGGLLIAVLFFAFAANMALSGLGSFS